MKLPQLPGRRPEHIDRGPKMTLADAAERCGVDVDWLRTKVRLSDVRPVQVCRYPTRYYYSLLKIKELVRLSGRGVPH